MTEWEFGAFISVHAETEDEAVSKAAALVSGINNNSGDTSVSLDDGPPLALDWEKA